MGGPGEEVWTAPKQRLFLKLHTPYPRAPKLFWCATSLGLMSLCRVSACEVHWVGLRRLMCRGPKLGGK